MKDIRLLAIDLDGTLVGPTNEYFRCMEFREKLGEFLSQTGAQWAICTGRSRSGFGLIFQPMLELGIRPDYLVTRDTYIFTVTRRGWVIPHFKWNVMIRKQIIQHNASVNATFREWHNLFSRWDFGIIETIRTKRRLVFHFESMEAADQAFKMLQSKAKTRPRVKVRRYQDTVWAESDVNSKGLAVKKLAELIGLRPEQILAVGDGKNDVSMMQPDVARMTGCPRNARPEVIELVHESGGHVAKTRNLAGAIEVLDAYTTGTVCSDLPADWIPTGVPAGSGAAEGEERWHRRYVIAFLVIGMALAVLMLVIFAYFGLLPRLR
jgi:HAD superfamily hydrolase (TIGR01484 family)